MINQQVSLVNQVLKNPKCDNAQHVPKNSWASWFWH
jgi:hypothetical protein